MRCPAKSAKSKRSWRVNERYCDYRRWPGRALCGAGCPASGQARNHYRGGELRAQPVQGLAARSIALSISSVQIFRALGLWPSIAAQAAPIRHIHVSARARWGVTRLHADDYELEALGYVVENQVLSDCLLQAVQASELIELQQKASLTRSTRIRW